MLDILLPPKPVQFRKEEIKNILFIKQNDSLSIPLETEIKQLEASIDAMAARKKILQAKIDNPHLPIDVIADLLQANQEFIRYEEDYTDFDSVASLMTWIESDDDECLQNDKA